jgi:hypothetical protein
MRLKCSDGLMAKGGGSSGGCDWLFGSRFRRVEMYDRVPVMERGLNSERFDPTKLSASNGYSRIKSRQSKTPQYNISASQETCLR